MGSEEHTDQEQVDQQEIDMEEVLSDVVDDAPAESEQSPVVDLQVELDAANARADDNWEKLLLAKADVENIRRRTQKDIEKAHRFSIEKFAKDILAVVDSLEMGLAAADSMADDVASIKEGMELTYKQLLSSLERSGVEQVNPEGESFNPDLHQAISMVPSEEHAHNTVMQVFQKGYTLNSRLMRPAMVIVSQSSAPAGTKEIDKKA